MPHTGDPFLSDTGPEADILRDTRRISIKP